jgi:LysM repeat protein
VANSISCFACDREPSQQCSRCGRPYCEEHGEELCDNCMRPASGIPPSRLYYGSIVALLVGTALALYFFIQPSESSGDGLTPFVEGTSAPQQSRTATAGSTVAPGATGTAQASGTRPAGTTTPAPGTTTYTVTSGDTLNGICERVKPASMTVTECSERIISLNQLSDADALTIGQTLTVPR